MLSLRWRDNKLRPLFNFDKKWQINFWKSFSWKYVSWNKSIFPFEINFKFNFLQWQMKSGEFYWGRIFLLNHLWVFYVIKYWFENEWMLWGICKIILRLILGLIYEPRHMSRLIGVSFLIYSMSIIVMLKCNAIIL